jgi:hypothetical protein
MYNYSTIIEYARPDVLVDSQWVEDHPYPIMHVFDHDPSRRQKFLKTLASIS